jgi:Tol biopolymer transport system component
LVAVLAAISGFAALAISMSQGGDAAFPGVNGRIAYANGNSYAYGSSGIWSANADGTSPQLLTDGSNDSDPSYSPDGTRIAFGRKGGIAVMNADGTGLSLLLSGSWSQSSPSGWQQNYKDPDSGKIIPFVKIQTYREEWRSFSSPSFSPSGSQLVVAEDGGTRIDTSVCAVEALNDPECIGFGEPGAYSNFEFQCLGCGGRLITVNSTTGALTGELTPVVNGRRDLEPAYAANGKIAFTRHISGSSSIYVIDSPGAVPLRVTAGQWDRAPDFSPDSSRIVYDHGEYDIGLTGASGGTVALLPVPALPEESGGYTNSPAFSPDGSRVVFSRVVYGHGGKSGSGLFTMGLDGSGLTRVAESGFGPSWQPVAPHAAPAIRPKAKLRKGKVKLDKKGRATVGKITCGSTPCKLKVLSAKLKAGRKACRVETRLAKKLAPGKSGKLGVKVSGKCLTSLRKAGKGTFLAKVRVTDALGKKVLKLKSTLLPGKARAQRKKVKR